MEDKNVTRLLNNTYDEKCVGQAIGSIQLSNYNYLYQLQKELMDYTRFDFTKSDIKRIMRTQYNCIKNKYAIKVLKEFINPSLKSRFKRSPFYNRLLSLFDIESDSLFQYSCLVFINGTLYTGIKLFPTDEFTYIILENDTAIKLINSSNVSITVIICPNFRIMSQKTNTYRLNKSIPVEDSYYTDNNTKYQYLHTITSDDTAEIITTTRSKGLLSIASEIPEKYHGISFYANSIGLQYLEGSVIIKNQEYFSIPQYNMPVVSDVMLVFKKTASGLIYQHDVTIDSFYPNIYRLNNIDKSFEYYILYFYHGSEIIDKGKAYYENKFSLLDRINFDLLDGYRNNNLPNVVKNYVPENVIYSIKDFTESSYTSTIDYKDSKLKSLIVKDSDNSSSYFDIQVDGPQKVYLDVSTVDLERRKRINTVNETPKNPIYFKNHHYVFVIRKNIIQDPYNTRIFIDGMIQLFHTITENEHNIYIYIPCEFINSKSFLEFESYKNVIVNKEFTVTNREALVDLSETGICFNFKDIIILDNDDNVIGYDKYDIYIKMKSDYISLQDKYNTHLKNPLKLVFSDNVFNNKKLKMKIIHKPFYTTQEIVTNDDRGKAIYINTPVSRDKSNFRIFRNGKLIPRELYDIKYRKNINSEFGVDILIDKQVGDVIVVDIIPMSYREVLYMDIIPESGFIDASRYLDKPFSLKWYDVYLNGKKLHLNNIDIISPTKFFIQGVNSRRTLSIVESNRDEEYFGIASDWVSYNDKLWEEFPNLKEQIISQHALLLDSEDILVPDIVSPISVDFDRFYEYYAKHQTLLNPEEVDIPNEIWEQFDDLKTDNVIILNPDIAHGGPSILEILDFD